MAVRYAQIGHARGAVGGIFYGNLLILPARRKARCPIGLSLQRRGIGALPKRLSLVRSRIRQPWLRSTSG
eukprot:6192105-Prymnesium_polylepis.1